MKQLPPARSSAYTSATDGSLLSRKRSEGIFDELADLVMIAENLGIRGKENQES
jgi:hypothetical protein